ncbi:unnamed protein product, partial [Prorocentrum cordatum]
VGITDENLAYWQLTANPSELEEASQLRPSQRLAVRHIRNLARESHAKALPELKNRVTRLGFTEVDVNHRTRVAEGSLQRGAVRARPGALSAEVDLHMALAWVRELAPMIVHVNLEKLGEFLLKDSHYRNQFETNSSGGLLKPAARVKWERGLFGTAYNEETPGSERPKYGVQNSFGGGPVGKAEAAAVRIWVSRNSEL